MTNARKRVSENWDKFSKKLSRPQPVSESMMRTLGSILQTTIQQLSHQKAGEDAEQLKASLANLAEALGRMPREIKLDLTLDKFTMPEPDHRFFSYIYKRK